MIFFRPGSPSFRQRLRSSKHSSPTQNAEEVLRICKIRDEIEPFMHFRLIEISISAHPAALQCHPMVPIHSSAASMLSRQEARRLKGRICGAPSMA
ncbi:hypothetical protein MESS4_620008 [Mesorhizobium sp. STM 4661]|nr:hypothetical protein MESS4_620008 [Mesorhizobium sp. STM 4661]